MNKAETRQKQNEPAQGIQGASEPIPLPVSISTAKASVAKSKTHQDLRKAMNARQITSWPRENGTLKQVVFSEGGGEKK